MIVFKLLKNPLVKICGICLVMYFGLFSERKNPNALSQRFSSENIDKSKDIAARKIRFITTSIEMANSSAETQEVQDQEVLVGESEEEKKVIVRDLQEGLSNKTAICGSEVEIVYVIFDQAIKQVESNFKKNLVLNGNQESLIESNLIGMKEGGIREITVWPDAKISDQKILKLMKRYNSKLVINISMISVGNHNDKMKCN